MSAPHFQIVVLGSGFAGSLAAMMAHRSGFSTAIIERGRHPRFAIGESTTPLANLLLEEIADEYDLPAVRPLCKWGAWQKELPHLACGIKRGFTFFHHELGKIFPPDLQRARQLLVGASPNEHIADTHWYRPDVDHYLVEQARKMGLAYWDETGLTGIMEEADGLRLFGQRHGKPFEMTAGFVIDATGPRGCLFKALKLPESTFDSLPPVQALFSHFKNVRPLPGSFCAHEQNPPFPPEQAAVHHLFPGGWIWSLRFDNGITSAGVAATGKFAHALNFRSGAPAWQKLLEQLPSLAQMFDSAEAVAPFVHSPSLAFRTEVITGPNWALLPSAAGFVDPLLSTGFPLALLGVQRLGKILRQHWRQPAFHSHLENYSRSTLLELDAAAQLVAALYANLHRFDLFKDLTLLYFAAASFSETARRLEKPRLADSFLLCHHPVFGPQLREICAQAVKPLSPREVAKLRHEIREAIEPFDVAGLTDDNRHPWYPALVEDLSRNAPKLGATPQDITALLRRCGLKSD
jgi:tetracycline 7-halogenase / FADH2 O2-dependent halogenase